MEWLFNLRKFGVRIKQKRCEFTNGNPGKRKSYFWTNKRKKVPFFFYFSKQILLRLSSGLVIDKDRSYHPCVLSIEIEINWIPTTRGKENTFFLKVKHENYLCLCLVPSSIHRFLHFFFSSSVDRANGERTVRGQRPASVWSKHKVRGESRSTSKKSSFQHQHHHQSIANHRIKKRKKPSPTRKAKPHRSPSPSPKPPQNPTQLQEKR